MPRRARRPAGGALHAPALVGASVPGSREAEGGPTPSRRVPGGLSASPGRADFAPRRRGTVTRRVGPAQGHQEVSLCQSSSRFLPEDKQLGYLLPQVHSPKP